MTTIVKSLKLTGTKNNDTLVGGEKADTLNGLAGDDFLRGNAGNDSLNGGDGNDSLDGGSGADKMIGGNGNDYYVVDNAKDVVTETNRNLAIGGDDIIETSLLTYTLPSNVENLILTGTQNSKGFGNTLNNTLLGNSANNELSGNTGNDALFGQEGDDTLTGGKGDDLIDGGSGDDTAIFSHKISEYDITLSDATQDKLTVKYIGKGNVDGTDTIINTEFLKFSDKTLNVADFINAQKPAPIVEPPVVTPEPTPPVVTPPVIVEPTPPVIEIPISAKNDETKAPFIYQSNNLQNIDSVSALLTYNPKVSNGVDYSTSETEQWRTRASSDELAIDLTQTTKTTNEITLQGQLESSPKAQVWYKINLTQADALQVQDVSNDAAKIDVAIFKSAGQNSLTYNYSLYDATQQLNSYHNVPAGDYFVRIDKGDSNATQALDFKIVINTQPTDEFIVPQLKFNTNNSTIRAELSPAQTEVFYKFKVDSTSKFALDATLFANQFEIDLIQPLASGGYEGTGYSLFQSAPNKQIYELSAGTYYLDVKALKALSNALTLDIPVVSSSPINFNTTFKSVAPSSLKADLANAKNAVSKDAAGNLELTYTFDLSRILGTDDAKPNATPFSVEQENAARLALHEYENLAKLTFRELPAGSTEKANLTFTNVSSLGSAAGEASTSQAGNGDFSKVTIRIDASDNNHANVAVGENGYTTLLHEIGHSLGFKHPRSYGSGGAGSELPFLATDKDSTQYTIMSYNEPTYLVDGYDLNANSAAVSAKTPLLYDVAAIQKLYGANQNFNSSDTVYRWEKDTNPYLSIWDGGGIDTIDASNQTQKQVIDLRAGEFSSIGAVTERYSDNSTKLYPAKNNVSIAYDTIIENAIGSNQDDTIIGNSVANQLTGDLGKDVFVFASTLSDFNVDTITDFNVADDSLMLDHAVYKALNSSNVLTAQELFISANATAAENATQRVIFNTSAQSLYYDADGAGGESAILFALLPNVSTLNAGQIFIQG
ncbi:MAG: M10 family metallopeptidase C-terminal domain-containing protein [Methylococcales bacterium]|nr:M10 family metallopeptidase C-terminal domain-containing protein [Methylococcales bacterium]